MVVSKDTTPKQIQECIALHYREEVNYLAAHRVKTALLDNTIEQHREAFRKLPHYIDRLRTLNPTGHFHLQLTDDQFGRVFVAPSASQQCLSKSRRIFGLDGTFLTGKFVLTLLLAVGIDSNGQTTILAWAIVESENVESWKYFLSHLNLAMPDVFGEPLIIISDRDKGLDAVKLPDNLLHVICCQHLKINALTGRGGPPLNKYFWNIVKAPTEEKFTYHMNQLRQMSALASAYLEKIDPAIYAEAYVPGNRYGHFTSNINESINNVLKVDRKSDVLTLLGAIWDRVMQARFSRFTESQKEINAQRFWTPRCAALMQEARSHAGGLRVKMSCETKAKIVTPEGWIFDVEVDWETRKMLCSCKRPQQNELPCGHVMAMLMDQQKTVSDFIPWAWTCYNWALQHSTPVPLIRTDDLETIAERPCHPPQTRVPRGRPRTQRLRKGQVRGRRGKIFEDEGAEMSGQMQNELAVNRRRPHCSTCGEMGHNMATCRRPHN